MSADPPVKSAQRTVEVLEYLAGHGGRPTLTALCEGLGYPKSSLSMLLRTLTAAGWVDVDETGTRYSVGLRALLVGTAYLDADPVVAAARETLDALAAATGETIHLARIDGADVVYLATRPSPHYTRAFSRVGRRLPARTTALGKALLAERSDDPELRAARARGYALDHGESLRGVTCFGAALRHRHPATDAISCSVPDDRLTPGREAEIVAALLAARDRLERVLG